MKKTLSVLLTLGLIAGTYITAQANDRRSITVNGKSEISVPSDIATMKINVTTRAKLADHAVEENAKRMNEVKKVLQKEGYEKEKLKTDNYNMYKDSYADKEKDRMYNVSHTIKINIENIEKTGIIIDKVTKAGATDIHSLSFTLKDSKKYRSQALANAIIDAKNKAEIIAKTLNKKIVNIISVNEGMTEINPYTFESRMLGATDDATSIESSDTKVIGEVTVVFEIA